MLRFCQHIWPLLLPLTLADLPHWFSQKTKKFKICSKTINLAIILKDIVYCLQNKCQNQVFQPVWPLLLPLTLAFMFCLFSKQTEIQNLFNKAKGTLVPERGWKYYILPTKVHPQTSSPEFGPSSVLGPGTCFKAYNLIQSQDALFDLKNECYKKLVKKFSLPPSSNLPPSPLLLMTRSAKLD